MKLHLSLSHLLHFFCASVCCYRRTSSAALSPSTSFQNLRSPGFGKVSLFLLASFQLFSASVARLPSILSVVMFLSTRESLSWAMLLFLSFSSIFPFVTSALFSFLLLLFFLCIPVYLPPVFSRLVHIEESVDPKSGRKYYYHSGTRESRWKKPEEFDIQQRALAEGVSRELVAVGIYTNMNIAAVNAMSVSSLDMVSSVPLFLLFRKDAFFQFAAFICLPSPLVCEHSE